MAVRTTLALLLLAACSDRTPPRGIEHEATTTPVATPDHAALDRARRAAQALGQTLKSRLLAAMTASPEAAVTVCAEEAGRLSAEVAAEHGARVGRSSLRLRQPRNVAPSWVQGWLEQHRDARADAIAPSSYIEGRVARFVAPIAVEGPCLVCHGPIEGIPEPVREILAARYPDDRATGYALGDLRGALWAEADL